MVNKPLLRPAISGGRYVARGGLVDDRHNFFGVVIERKPEKENFRKLECKLHLNENHPGLFNPETQIDHHIIIYWGFLILFLLGVCICSQAYRKKKDTQETTTTTKTLRISLTRPLFGFCDITTFDWHNDQDLMLAQIAIDPKQN